MDLVFGWARAMSLTKGSEGVLDCGGKGSLGEAMGPSSSNRVMLSLLSPKSDADHGGVMLSAENTESVLGSSA